VTNFLLQKLGLQFSQIDNILDHAVRSYPKVSGGQPYLSSEVNSAMQKAQAVAQKMGDQFISVEHLLLGILDTKNEASKILKDAGLTEKELLAAIKDLRKGSKVNSQTAEDKRRPVCFLRRLIMQLHYPAEENHHGVRSEKQYQRGNVINANKHSNDNYHQGRAKAVFQPAGVVRAFGQVFLVPGVNTRQGYEQMSGCR